MTWTAPQTWQTGSANKATAAMFNPQIRDNLNHLYRAYVSKTAQEDRTTTTLADDAALALPIGVSEVWEWSCALLIFAGTTTPDVKIAWAVPAGATGAWGVLSNDVTTLTQIVSDSFSAYGDSNVTSVGMSSGYRAVHMSGTVVNSTTAGVLRMRWAQNTASGTTSVYTGSYITGFRLS